jgi:polysaccharide chain length determinant protein (PEP-CTERM system associated)
MKDMTQTDIEKYQQIILRHRYLFIAVSLLCLSIIVWGSFFMPKIYEAKSTVLIEENIIKNLVKGIVVSPSLEERIRVLSDAMKSRTLLLKVIDALDLDTKAETQVDIELMIKHFQDNTKIKVKRNNLFTVSYKGKDPKMVRDYVNTLISQYIEENKGSKRDEVYAASKFLSERIKYYKEKLDAVEERLIAFRREKGIYLATDERTLVTSIRSKKEEMEKVAMEIKKLEAKKRKIQQQLSGEEPFTLAIIDSEEGGSLPTRLRLLQQKLSILLTKYTENYPEVVRIRAEIDTIKKQLETQVQDQTSEKTLNSDMGLGTSIMNPVYQQLKEEQLRIDSEIDSLRAKRKVLSKRIKKLEFELKHIPAEKKELANLERERDTYQKIYEQLLERLGQAEVSEQMEMQDKGITFRIVDPAVLPTRPVSPDRVKLIIFGFFVGIAAGIGAVFLREYLDNSIRDVETLKNQFGLKVLAVIPRIVTEQDIEKKKKLDRRVYIFSILYLSVIAGIFVKELLNKFL